MSLRSRRGAARAAITAVAALAALPAAAGAQQRDLIVQSTTSVRDSGLLEQVLGPEFSRAYPQYNLKFVAVGTGQAITNARAGQGDVLIAHSPALEQQFLADGFSREPFGRTVMWNDYVIVGPANDPAGLRAGAGRDAVGAFEAIAAAGTAGRATFVSRGDNSGTNVKEREIWGASGIGRTTRNEPAEGAGNPAYYRKAGLGMADTLRLVQQCPFPNGGCYTITDRGTYQQLVSNGAVTGLSVLMEGQAATARGGETLMVNAYRAYAIDPVKYPAVNAEGALAFLDFVTTSAFQTRLTSFPSAARPGFFAAAFPQVETEGTVPRRISAARAFTVSGSVASAVPGDAVLDGLSLRLARFTTPLTPSVLARTRASADGSFRLSRRLTRSGEVFLTAPRFRDLSPLRYSLGRVTVRADVTLGRVRASGARAVVAGRIYPAAGRREAVLQIQGRRSGARSFRTLRRVSLRSRGSRYRTSVTLPDGRWQLRVRYVDSGIVSRDDSPTRSVSVR